MKHRLFLSLITAGVLANQAQAGSMGPVVASKDWSWVGSISAGPVWSDIGSSRTFFLEPDIEKSYLAGNDWRTLAFVELFAGAERPINDRLSLQLGLALAMSSNDHLSGDILEDADADFNNFRYRYSLQHKRALVKGKLSYDAHPRLRPYLTAGIGLGYNKAREFVATPKISNEVPAPPFQDRSKTSLAYALGAGIQTPLSDRTQLGIGYEFSDWGKSSLARAPGQAFNTSLYESHAYTHGLIITLSSTA